MMWQSHCARNDGTGLVTSVCSRNLPTNQLKYLPGSGPRRKKGKSGIDFFLATNRPGDTAPKYISGARMDAWFYVYKYVCVCIFTYEGGQLFSLVSLWSLICILYLINTYLIRIIMMENISCFGIGTLSVFFILKKSNQNASSGLDVA